MIALAVPLLLLAQAPELPPPEVVAAPPPSLAVGFVDQHLLSVEASPFSGLQVRQGERTLRLGDDGGGDGRPLSMMPLAGF